MKIHFVAFFVFALFLSFSDAEIEARFPGTQPIAVQGAPGFDGTTDCITGVVLPCDTDYYALQSFTDVQVGDYLSISYDDVGEVSQFTTTEGRFYVVNSDFENLQEELASNNNIKDTLGQLPGPNNYEYRCNGNCDIEIVWSQLENSTYYLAVEGNGDGNLVYQICLAYRSVPIIDLVDGTAETIFFDQRPTFPPRDEVLHYRFYSLDIPQSSFSEGSYLVVNVSRAEPFPGVGLRLMYESLPEAAVDTGVIGAIDVNSAGRRVDDTIFQFCVDTTTPGRPDYDHPVNGDPSVPCDCFTDVQLFGAGPAFQLTCQLVVDPCHFRYGRWYMSVELPERAEPGNPLDITGLANYTITATTVQPSITNLIRNVTFKAFVEPEAVAHFKIDVPANTMTTGESHLLVHLSNVRNGFVDLFVHRGTEIGRNLAGGPEGCSPANATCRTCDACNVVIEKCHFIPGTYYISVGITYDEAASAFLINDADRLPITFTLRTNWLEDPTPSRLVAGVPVAKFIGEALYDFYVIDVPPTIDTWLFVELYAKANDTEVVLAILHDEIPGGECYARPDFYCMTGDPRGLRWDSGSPAFLDNDPVQRESCSFMIQTCELSPGPLYLSVYGHHTGYAAYGDTTFYQVPVHYTLWADFDVALSVQSGVSYSETVFEKQYQHYYIRADQVQQGSSLSVEITNIQHGVPQTIEGFINYNYLAGNCPCYDHLYNCTGALPCTATGLDALADIDSVLNCCTMVVPASDFRPGVWYIAVLGVNEDYFSYTTPIGYTITATVHDAPVFQPLILGQAYQGEVPQWNKTLEYVNFRLGADAVPLNDLVFKATFVQNCDFMGKHDDTRDTLWMYVNKGAPATEYLGGWVHKCKVDTTTQSFCTIVVPHCEWEGDDWFVAIQGKYSADFVGRFTLRAFTDEVRDFQLTDGRSHYDRVSVGRYNHYFIETVAEEDQYLAIDLYTNQDQDAITAYLMKDQRAGDSPCFRHFDSCVTESCCTWQLHACDLEPGRYYISVFGSHSQFYDTSVEYTLTAMHKPVATLLFNGDPFTGHLKEVGDVQHYRFEVSSGLREGTFLLFEVDNVKHGAVTAYAQYGFLAGRCPCYIWEHTCTASADPFGPAGAEWCEIRIPSCELKAGEYFFSLWAVEKQSPDPPVFITPIGYTLEVNLITPVIVDPVVALGRDVINTEPFQFIANARYNHYEFSVDDDDFGAGHHVIVEITSVRDGALFVYYNQLVPGDEDPACHIAELCTSGLGAGLECYWQIPYCLARPLGTGNKHYITVEGKTGRIQASYNILIYKQGVPSYIRNDAFTLDNNLLDTPVGAELDILHDKRHEPNGWTQFMRLTDVPARLDEGRGEILEVFFYRITNNPGEPLSFNVYLHPNEPAGAHECCDESNKSALGSCQGAPCSQTADTTTSSNNGPDVFTHTCSLGTGIGSDGNGDPLFGERCVVRVWPCEFNKYCGNETRDWFMSVVPLSPTNLGSNGAGLQYSTQWRVRDIRLTDSGTVGSIDLTGSLNTYDYTQTYSVVSSTTESQGWLSFYVDFEERTNSRLSVQTRFTQGSGVVYINGDEFASDTDTCHIYSCSSGSTCDSTGRFYVSECCALKYERYYITVRNTGSVGSTTSVQFRLVETLFPEALQLDDHPSEAAPFVATSGPSVYPGVTGVAGDNYDYYILTIDDDDLDRHQSWVVEVERPDVDSGVLDVYIRFGAPPGQFGPDNAQSFFGTSDEGCHGWQYSCSADLPGSRCLWQIPHCDLIEGHWWVAIGNPNFNFELTPSDLPDYTFTTYISDPPLALGLDEQFTSVGTADSALLQHYSFNITADELDFDDREELTGYWVKYLRFQLDNVGSGSATMYVNYGALAGPNSAGNCLFNFQQTTCTGQCFVDITPCEFDGDDLKLKTGVYYVSVRHDPSTSYSLTARVYRDDYFLIPLTETIVGTGNRLGVVDDFYSHTSTQTELNVNGDGDGNYRYVIDIPGVDDDDLADNEYFVFNFTASAFAGNADAIHFDVFRDDCTRYSCDLLGPRSWCTIDALELAPCSAKAGRFFIRAENPSAAQFTINLYHNETVVQNLSDRQIITEIVYPYEYQEYFYDAVSVGEGATLSVSVCSICGDVEAFIRPDLPAGPVPDNTGYEKSCSIDSCRATGPDDTSFEQTNNCCTLFLDTCQYEQRGYYIGVRGVSTVYPNSRNEHLYIPAKYTIQAAQTNINVTDISFASCPKTVNYYASWAQVPRQYAIDIESLNVGAMLKFSLRLPTGFATAANEATLYVQANQTVGYSDGCPLDGPTDPALTCTTTTECHFVIPYCKLSPYCGGRYYIWADAPRGSEVLVERWDPVVPIVHSDVHYSATINAPGPNVGFDLPWTPNRQIYRFDLDPKLFDDANYYEKFFVRVILKGVSQGSVGFTVNSGHSPYVSDSGCHSPVFLDTSSCSSVGEGEECWVEMQYSTLLQLSGGDEHNIPHSYWLTVHGLQQTCELHSIKYSFVVQTHWILTYYPVGETICNVVEEQQYNFHRLRPRAVENPQESILRIQISDLDVNESVNLLVQDHYLASSLDSTHFVVNSGAEGRIDAKYICGYDDLYLSVYGESATDRQIDYKMSVEKIHVRVKDLMDDMVYHADDDDDDACPHEHDFYRFRTAWPHGHHDGAFFRVLVDSEFPTQVYVNKNDFAWSGCADSGYGENDPAITGTTSVNVYDFCDFEDGTYFITVVSDGPYYIYTNVRDDAKELTIGEVFHDTLEPGMYQMYTLDICTDWTEVDDRLVVEISDVDNGDVYGWIRHNGNPGNPDNFGYNQCSEGHAFADYGANESGYDFLLVDHCSLKGGQYRILIRASPHEGSPERDCEHVTFRLFPYLIDYQIEPDTIFPNIPITDAVDFWTINRIVPEHVPFANYYRVHPRQEGEGFYEQISQAVARLSNVEGGLLHLRVMCDSLATAEFGYIDGEIYGLVSNSADDLDFDPTHDGLITPADKMQSGRYPFIYQNIMDHRESALQPECTGCADLCCQMTFDDLDQYIKDKSCAIWVPSCYWIWADFYIAVEPIQQFAEDHHITYSLEVDQTRDFRLLQPDHHSVNSFENDNWDYDFFYSISSEPQSMRWRVVVTEGEGVLVTIRNHRCPRQATWVKEVWCDADYFDRPWMCDLEIPTRAAHPGDNAFFVAVYGKNATYSIAFWRGRENCHDFTGSGRTEGLDFCAGLVPYATWRWDSYHNLDQEANCFFEELYQHFRVQPCYTGVTPECNATLQAFACHESFRRCDAEGFYTGTCRDSCEAVVYECANWFETVDLEHYNCTSSRYLDGNAQTCTGSPAFAHIDPATQHFLGNDPNLLLFKSSPSSSPASALSVSFVVSLLFTFFALMF
eukprot:CAMPEP_0117025160 /NCGR_PEP_ID=MMETSP0472-20121206/18612_1 /TAXON_ID=693140 ORGANISM="Tiarina fusus, Strain LIS" /NCGR_SAMPLE_ID=MMETSP0472 /ASSEMBLY_ACC=CAM_ASM_000603 /LENGTH=3343 /DNA_ID=CAMNT_0004731795 /DNA_START=70 /DNA_END=10101 /DNA_ORIENTATION=+